jgi:hypothetical protein
MARNKRKNKSSGLLKEEIWPKIWTAPPSTTTTLLTKLSFLDQYGKKAHTHKLFLKKAWDAVWGISKGLNKCSSISYSNKRILSFQNLKFYPSCKRNVLEIKVTSIYFSRNIDWCLLWCNSC